MKPHRSIDQTVAYYDQHAVAYSSATVGLDVSRLYSEFLPLIPIGGRILDAGCGSGRDSVYFKQRGYVVEAFDASIELVAIASQALREPVQLMTFGEVEASAEFDGVWACASLLHVSMRELTDVLNRLTKALKLGAPMYMSFKIGLEEVLRDGRLFNDFDEPKLRSLLAHHPRLKEGKLWRTPDVRLGLQHDQWLNAIVMRT